MSHDSAKPTQIVLLGTGTPNADPTRSGPAVAVVVGRTPYLVDFGPGVVRQASAAHADGVEALEISNLRRAFLTHLHSDHTAGYPDLMLTPWTLGREAPLEVYGPPGLRAMTDRILSAYAEDIRERLEGLEPANKTGHQTEAFEIDPGTVYEDEWVVVEAFRVNHGSWPAYGYRFTTSDRVIVISGDTAPFAGWEAAYRTCDVLIHEVHSFAGLASQEPAWQAYHRAVHTSTTELAEVASVARPKLLVLYHQLFHGVSESTLLQEVRDRYSGEVVCGRDLGVY
jgi:ribonuclease BN (tRNA processing enzyme)